MARLNKEEREKFLTQPRLAHLVTLRPAGTPHVVIIDKNRRIRFSRLGSFDIARAEALIGDLLADGDPGGRPGASAPPKTEQR